MILFLMLASLVLGLWLGAHYAAIKLDDLYRERQARKVRAWLEQELGQ